MRCHVGVEDDHKDRKPSFPSFVRSAHDPMLPCHPLILNLNSSSVVQACNYCSLFLFRELPAPWRVLCGLGAS
ncbi:hypothetical protein SLEP1_g24731 [Rubroshorea leprosula]|nr:hypothetical protein SLEP1_g24731 [Rubroshorea leprosula]